jgi:F0F1-type ATP synthase assembly protein I
LESEIENQIQAERRTQGPNENSGIEMLISLLGSTGVGLVWGWLIAGVFNSGRKPILNVLLLIVASALLLAEVLWLAGWRSAVFQIHRCWQRVLYDRFGVNKPV